MSFLRALSDRIAKARTGSENGDGSDGGSSGSGGPSPAADVNGGGDGGADPNAARVVSPRLTINTTSMCPPAAMADLSVVGCRREREEVAPLVDLGPCTFLLLFFLFNHRSPPYRADTFTEPDLVTPREDTTPRGELTMGRLRYDSHRWERVGGGLIWFFCECTGCISHGVGLFTFPSPRSPASPVPPPRLARATASLLLCFFHRERFGRFLDEDEYVIASFRCSMVMDQTHAGELAVTNDHICFVTPREAYLRVIALSEVDKIDSQVCVCVCVLCSRCRLCYCFVFAFSLSFGWVGRSVLSATTPLAKGCARCVVVSATPGLFGFDSGGGCLVEYGAGWDLAIKSRT